MAKKYKKQHVLFSNVSTQTGTLVLLAISLPLFIFMMFTYKQSQLVAGASDYNPQGGYAHFNDMQNSQSSSGAGTTPFRCPPGAMCKTILPSGTLPRPQISCTPRPPCLDAKGKYKCYYPQIRIAWCPPTFPSTTPPLTPPSGCYAKSVCLQSNQCNTNAGFCQPQCKTIFICPSTTPIITGPQPSCHPEPTCNPKLGILCRPHVPCDPGVSLSGTSAASIPHQAVTTTPPANIADYITSFFKGLFGK